MAIRRALCVRKDHASTPLPLNVDVRRGMFYVYASFGVAVFVAGVVLLPAWWKLVWTGVFVTLLMFMPQVLSGVLDPINVKRIRSYCEGVGVTDVRIELFPNHYGVHFRKNDRKHYARCRVAWGKIKWKGPSPGEIQ